MPGFAYLAALSASSKSPELSLRPRSRAGPSVGVPTQEDSNYLRVGFAARGDMWEADESRLGPPSARAWE